MATTQQHDNLRKTLLASAEPGVQWFALIDAATNETLPGRAQDAGLQVSSLYTGQLGELAAPGAPFLITFSFESPFADWFFTRWGRSHGILLQAGATFDDVWKHFRRFLLVKDEAGKKYRFRFYDPRVLRAFLPSCSPEEVEEFFGPVVSYCAEGRSGKSLFEFRRTAKGCSTREVPVAIPSEESLEQHQHQAIDGGSPVADLTLLLQDEESEQPIAGANCYCVGPEYREVASDDSGRATISGMSVGKYRVMARHADGRSGVAHVTLSRDGSALTVVCRKVS